MNLSGANTKTYLSSYIIGLKNDCSTELFMSGFSSLNVAGYKNPDLLKSGSSRQIIFGF